MHKYFFPQILTLFTTLLLVSLCHGSTTQFKTPLNGLKSSLTVYAYPAYKPLNWTSPRSAMLSFTKTGLKRQLLMNDAVKVVNSRGEKGAIPSSLVSVMGHTINHIQCTLPDGNRYERWSSFSGQGFPKLDKRNLLIDKLGIGVIFYPYPDGHIIEGEENFKRLAFFKASRDSVHPRYLQFEIDPPACARLQKIVSFFESFHFAPGTPLQTLLARPKSQNLYFDSVTDPYESYLKRQKDPHAIVGGGCAPYAAALVKAAGHFDRRFDYLWRVPLRISERLIGGVPDDRGDIRRVSVLELLAGPLGEHWMYAGDKYRDVSLYDPQRIWDFIGDMNTCLAGQSCSPDVEDVMKDFSRQLIPGETQVFADDVPNPLFKPIQGDQISFEPEFLHGEQPVEGFIWRLHRP